MQSPLRRTVLCLALMLPAFAFAQSAEPAPSAESPAPAATAPEPATPAVAPAAAPTAAPVEEPAAKPAVAGKIGAPPAGKGQVVFFRPLKFLGAAIVYKVREGDKVLGTMSTGRYFVTVADPGTHVYSAHTEAKDALTLEVEAGETYYVQGTITMGFMAGHPNLAPSDQAAFDGMATKLKPAE